MMMTGATTIGEVMTAVTTTGVSMTGGVTKDAMMTAVQMTAIASPKGGARTNPDSFETNTRNLTRCSILEVANFS